MTESKRQPNWVIVYKAMSNGMSVKMPDGHTYTVIDGKLCLRLVCWNDGSKLDDPPDEFRWVESTYPLNMFIADCESISEEEIVGMVYNLGMDDRNRKEKRGKYRKLGDNDDR